MRDPACLKLGRECNWMLAGALSKLVRIRSPNLPGAGTEGRESVNLSRRERSQALTPDAPGQQRDMLGVGEGLIESCTN